MLPDIFSQHLINFLCDKMLVESLEASAVVSRIKHGPAAAAEIIKRKKVVWPDAQRRPECKRTANQDPVQSA